MTFCAIDFGTSNSAVAVPEAGGGTRLIALEAGQSTMPTAVFYAVEPGSPQPPELHYGRAALAAYVDGFDGRLMRSMKSVLGSPLVTQDTDLGAGHRVKYLDVITAFLRHLKVQAEAQTGAPIRRAVLGRPVFFVDEDPARDAAAQDALATAARAVGFEELRFQYEPIAAALDHERTAAREELVLVADIGGGTSDFSLVRVGPRRQDKLQRQDDILASHGVHVAGTDFDRRVELEAVLPSCGFRGRGPGGREVPSRVYHDLATWHLINTVYTPPRVAELRGMKDFYADAAQHRRLMKVVQQHLGHALGALAEGAKIDVARQGRADIDLSLLEPGLRAALEEAQALQALDADLQRIAEAALETVRRAGVAPEAVDALYFTGGSTGLKPLTDRIAAAFPAARAVRGERFASVAQGLGLHAARCFGVAH
ncbi:Hsp70 family protein [Azohydromonas caseinilytica]|uniref:Hsp70 family protein n=1 Tax=Azohydromonas caseinilytica TaxID=2728836 RepID=A0A848F687_9BURK|nr:Hsp70 family protein [Azohydromonas caseinilytica]NML13873.1 Hsp70 family protein [Azohydromonas caseinilytica]